MGIGRHPEPARPLALRVACIAVVSVVLAACGSPASEGPSADPPPRTETNPEPVPLPFVAGDTLLIEDQIVPLGGLTLAALTGDVTPTAVLDASETHLLYSSFEYVRDFDFRESWSDLGIELGDPIGRPNIRLFNLDSGEDELLIPGAGSFALDAAGRLAYFKGDNLDYLNGETYLGSVVVRPSVKGEPETWIDIPGKYAVIAWAGPGVLFYAYSDEAVGEETGLGGLYISRGPGRYQWLGTATALVAVSPDGTRALLTSYSEGTPVMKLIDLETSGTIASLQTPALEASTGEAVDYVEGNGWWVGDRIVASTDSGLLVFKQTGNALEIEKWIARDKKAFPLDFIEPRLTPDGSRIVAWTPIKGHGGEARGRLYVWVECDIGSGRCEHSLPSKEQTFHSAANPSRP